MDRKQIEEYIDEAYNCQPDYPWFNYPNNAVFRHKHNRKWFAITMDVPKSKLGLESSEIIDIMNVKCDYYFICKYLQEDGFYPAYHMNKKNWISIALDGSTDDETIKFLLDMSYEMTRNK